MDQIFHSECLEKLCRVCGSYLQHSRAVYQCEDHKGSLQDVFKIDQTRDLDNTHPPSFCERCQVVLVKAVAAAKDIRVYLHSVKPFEWSAHTGVDCQVCNHMAISKKGERPKKAKKNRGRPTVNSAHTQLERIQNLKQDSHSDREEYISVLHSTIPWSETT